MIKYKIYKQGSEVLRRMYKISFALNAIKTTQLLKLNIHYISECK